MTAPSSFAVSLAEAKAQLTAPGAPFETAEVVIRGVPTRVWKHVAPTLAALVEQSREHGGRDFVVLGDERLTYAAHHRAVAALAHWLAAQGIGKGDRVALAMRNLPVWPVAFFAAAVIGAIIVPLNAWWTGAELTLALADCDASVLVADAERLARIAPHRGDLPMLRHLLAAGPAEGGAISLAALLDPPVGAPQAFPPVALAPDDDAAIFYTSGTTGRPKGVVTTHRALVSSVLSGSYAAARNALRRGDALPPAAPKVRLVATPLFHMTGCASGLVAGMAAGNTNVLMPRWDAGAALALIARAGVQVLAGVPTVAWQLLEHPDRTRHDISSLEAIAYGGAPGAPELVRRIAAELGVAPGNGWGMTETSGPVCILSGPDYLARPESCGPAVAPADLRIMAPDGAQPLPSGAVGELWVKGPMVARGYWKLPGETAATFLDGWVRTGDLARLDADGFCTIVDRTKDIIIRGGENIYSSEVEHVLHAHPAVLDAALIGRAHRSLGEEPVAVVQLAPRAVTDEDELRDWVRARLAPFKVPVAIRLVAQPLPRNAGGKIIKTDLRALFDAVPIPPTQQVA